jgi:hypothetical protein
VNELTLPTPTAVPQGPPVQATLQGPTTPAARHWPATQRLATMTEDNKIKIQRFLVYRRVASIIIRPYELLYQTGRCGRPFNPHVLLKVHLQFQTPVLPLTALRHVTSDYVMMHYFPWLLFFINSAQLASNAHSFGDINKKHLATQL